MLTSRTNTNNNFEESKGVRPQSENVTSPPVFMKSTEQGRRKQTHNDALLSYGGDQNYGIISEEKFLDIAQLQGEVDQIRNIMNQYRNSATSAKSAEPVPPSSIINDDEL